MGDRVTDAQYAVTDPKTHEAAKHMMGTRITVHQNKPTEITIDRYGTARDETGQKIHPDEVARVRTAMKQQKRKESVLTRQERLDMTREYQIHNPAWSLRRCRRAAEQAMRRRQK